MAILPWTKFEELDDINFLDYLKNLPEEEIKNILKIYEDCVKFNQDTKRSMSSRNWKVLYNRQIENAKIRVKWIKQILKGS